MQGLPLVVASGGHSSSRCAGLSLSRPLLLRSTGSRRASSVIVAHGPSCSAACGIFPDQGSNPCPLHWQADSQPLRHQGSPRTVFKWWIKLQFKSTGKMFSQTQVGSRKLYWPWKNTTYLKTKWLKMQDTQGSFDKQCNRFKVLVLIELIRLRTQVIKI